jgi:uncharacterized protein (TIGR00730 family)
MSRTLCVYCSSSNSIDAEYVAATKEVGAAMGANEWDLVYGGTNAGLMGVVADAALAAGVRVTGVIPEYIRKRGLAHDQLDSLIVTADMRERKAAMDHRADAFLVLPGGFGTLEEVFEILTLKQLQLHRRPIVFLNTRGVYNLLHGFLNHLLDERFAKPESNLLYHFADTPSEAFAYLEDYKPTSAGSKWL